MNITTIGDLDEFDFVKATLYGLSGSGKTRSFTTLPVIDNKKWLYVNADRGSKTISNLSDNPAISISNYKDLLEFDEWINKSEEYKKYSGLFIDTVSELAYLYVDRIREHRNVEKFTFDEWGQLKTRLQRMVRKYRDIDTNIIMLAQPKEREDELTKTTIFKPALEGSMNEEYPQHWDYILFSVSREINGEQIYYWKTKTSYNIRGKDRSSILPLNIKPNWELIFNADVLKREAINMDRKTLVQEIRVFKNNAQFTHPLI